jgi:UDP-N-acetylmuramyl pentapeptide synthase
MPKIQSGANSSAVAVHKGAWRSVAFTVPVPERHNVRNALPAVGVGLELELTPDHIRDGLDHLRRAALNAGASK